MFNLSAVKKLIASRGLSSRSRARATTKARAATPTLTRVNADCDRLIRSALTIARHTHHAFSFCRHLAISRNQPLTHYFRFFHDYYSPLPF